MTAESDWAHDPTRTGGRALFFSRWLHSDAASRRLFFAGQRFEDMWHMLSYWGWWLYDVAFFAYLTADDPVTNEEERRTAWARVADETENFLLVAEGAEVSRQVADLMIHRSINAARESVLYYVEVILVTDDFMPYERFYPWFVEREWVLGSSDERRAAELATWLPARLSQSAD